MFPLSASTGSSFAALLAGSKPNMIPDINATIRETYEAHIGGRKLKSDSTYEVQFKVRFVEGFVGEGETFFQVHGYNNCLPLIIKNRYKIIRINFKNIVIENV